ncbi:MAG: hypothetical protein IJ072_05305, partial [Oscillospiraceae bacterium]|nr:hypothetical protein [Oscillospiraceae bacterium]
DFITRSTDMRLGVNLFIASNAPAAQMIQSCQSGESGICDMLTAMAREAESCGKGKTFTCGDVLERLANGSCALAQAVSLKPPEEQ